MRIFLVRRIAVFALVPISALLCQVPATQRSVVVISLDGFPAYSLEDPQLPAPTLRRLIESGAQAKRMTTVNPTVTWPNHTSMVTGVRASEHGLLYNGSAVRTGTWPPIKIEPFIEKEKMVHAVTVYDLAHRAGLTTAQVNWVAIEHAPTITWEFPEMASVAGTIEREMVARGAVRASEIEQFRRTNIVRRDEIWTDAAVHIIREHKPNLLLFHLLTLDSVHHAYGPKSLAGAAAIGFLDGCVARVLEAIKAAGMEDRTTVIVVSDHGFKVVTKQIRAAAALTAANLAASVHVIPEGGTAMLYLDKTKAAELLPKVRNVFERMEGIAQIAGKNDFAGLGLPDAEREPQMPDLVLVAKSGYAFVGGVANPVVVSSEQKTGSHGYLNTDPELDAIFIASGYGIRAGVSLDRIANLDVAPTIAALLGLRFEGAIAGTTISSILK
jgi:predicted AlkP superfamily phosphohydrolase/phosphomutase